MENPEETLQALEEWTARRARSCGGVLGGLPRQLDEYLAHVARTGDPVFQWASIKPLIKEKLLSAVNEFHETAPGLDVPLAPNVDPFNYEAMRALLLERLDSFNSAPFTVQRLCELLTAPRKQYNRIDKFMRAVEKNVLVVSTREPGPVRREENESIERALNGSDGNSDCGVDVDMEDSTWRDLRQSVVDPLAGASNGDCPPPLPEPAPLVSEHAALPTEEKMDDTPEVAIESENLDEKIKKKIEEMKADRTKENSNELNKTEPSENMEIEVSKETEQSTKEPEQTESTSKIPESSPISIDNTPVTPEIIPTQVAPSSEDDSNSIAGTAETVVEAVPKVGTERESEQEQKSEPATSGEDSSSSNSSENTDGESERCGNDSASRSPERSGASEGDSSSEPTELHTPQSEPALTEKITEPVSIETENYTIADIPTESKHMVAETPEATEVTTQPAAPVPADQNVQAIPEKAEKLDDKLNQEKTIESPKESSVSE